MVETVGTLALQNNTSEVYTCAVTSSTCMLDNGDEGSNLQAFQNLTLNPQNLVPQPAQCVKADNNGGCAIWPSSFQLTFTSADKTMSFFANIDLDLGIMTPDVQNQSGWTYKVDANNNMIIYLTG
jgi:hypothetical protein